MPGFKPGFASCFAIRTRCTLACLDTSVSRHPLSALAVRRIPAESPKCASARCAFFHAGIQTRVRVLLCNPHPVHARVPRHFRVSPSPIGARCKANPGRVTKMRICSMRIFSCRDSNPGSRLASQSAPGARRCVPRSLCGAAFIHVSGVKRRITAHLGVSSARLGRGHGQTSGWAAPLALARRQSAPFFAV